MVVGFVGIVVPLLPGLPLIWAAVLIWTLETQRQAGWVVLAIATVLTLLGVLLRFLLPGRYMARAGVTTSSTVAAAVLGIAGFLVIPVVGVFLGFALGIYLAERIKVGTHATAWPSTKQALKAIALSIGIELLTGLTIVTTWLIGVTTIA